jgi:predicted nucleotidyltransferase component of viral defense system
MKDLALQAARASGGRPLNALREYVQSDLLWILQKTGLSLKLYFVGGTALRFLYRLPRFSEDLDFCAGRAWRAAAFRGEMERLERELRLAGYAVSLHPNEDRTVQKADFRFSGLLQELKLASRNTQKFQVSIEVDIHPPAGWTGERTIVNVHRPLLLQHYDLKSLFTAKLAALWTREYTKGRDYYDLFWYLSRWKTLRPEARLLGNALAQKKGLSSTIGLRNWKKRLRETVERADWRAIEADVRPFLERPDDLLVFTKDNLLLLLR